MSFEIINIFSPLAEKQAMTEILKCNDYSQKFGLTLTEINAAELIETRKLSLKNNGRIEFGSGIIDKIIREFCDSPYLNNQNYPTILNELVNIFYFYKNETLDLVSDCDLIKFMKKSFDGICQGSVELLYGRELNDFSEKIQDGYDFNPEIEYTDDETDEDI